MLRQMPLKIVAAESRCFSGHRSAFSSGICHRIAITSSVGPHFPTSLWTIQRAAFSDRLLGHSPMAAPTPATPTSESRIPTKDDVSIAGGVWNPTSAKRDKLAELKVELTQNQLTLDDAATPEETLDLQLADGVQWIVSTVDQLRVPRTPSQQQTDPAGNTDDSSLSLHRSMDPAQWEPDDTVLQLDTFITELQQQTGRVVWLNENEWQAHLTAIEQKAQELLATLPASRYLRHVWDFYSPPENDISSGVGEKVIAESGEEQAAQAAAANKVMARYRLQLTLAACEHLQESWKNLTTISDAALDRAAVVASSSTDESVDEMSNVRETLPSEKVDAVVRSYLLGSAADRVDAWWKMMDHDDDGLLEKDEMDAVAASCLAPVQSAIVALLEETLEAHPARIGAVAQEAETGTSSKPATQQKPCWRRRRREAKEKRRLLKMFTQASKNHFEDEVEMPHRLRCIYAWADKAHQDNKVDSVLIESSGWSGRKRYVELQPKISLPEFREVQQIHFTHLDRIGWEIMKSFREDLWVAQGKGRQSRELMRDCLLFLTVVSLVDYAIVVM